MNHLSIAVVGVGGIGSAFAYKLARAGHDVTVVARPGSLRIQQLQRDRAILLKTGERADVHVADNLDQQVAYDLVIVTTLAHQADSVIASLQTSQAKWVQFMFNNFNPERLRDAMGTGKCSFGMPFLMANLDGDGKLNLKINPGQKTLHGDQRWVDLFHGAGLPSSFEKNMLLWLRCHSPLCIGFESISIAGEKRKGGATWADSMIVARGVQAGYTIIRGLGYRIYPSSKSRLQSSPKFLLACMFYFISHIRSFRILLATGANECRALIDDIVAAASNAKPALTDEATAVAAMKPPVEN